MFKFKRRQSLLMASMCAAVLAAAVAVGQTAVPATAPASPNGVDQHGPTIKDTYKGHFLIGNASDLNGLSPTEQEMVKENYNIMTPENAMKPQPIHPQEGTYNFRTTDAFVDFCTKNNIAIHGHTLVWHGQTPNWFFDGGDKATITKRLQDHIATVVGRYKGKIHSWDVVNEVVNDGGGGKGASPAENLRNSQWLQTLGPDFIEIAFKAAHEADPKALLFYNDYNIENGQKHTSSLALVKRLIADKVPINGVGIQGHWSTRGLPYAQLDQAIADYAKLGMKVAISELDVTVNGTAGGQLNAGAPTGAGGATEAGLKAQADAYAKLFAIFEKHKDVIDRVTFWGLNDRRSWRQGQNPLIFDGQNQRKPSYVAIVEQLLHPNPLFAAPK